MRRTNAKARFLVPALILLGTAAVIGPMALVFGSARGQAAFGDSEAIGMNHLSSATVDVEVGSQSVRLVGENMAPGDRTIGSIEIRNEGTLPLRYALVGEPSDDLLLDWFTWDLWARGASSGCGRPPAAANLLVKGAELDAEGGAVFGDVSVGLDVGDRVLEPGASETICVAAAFDLAAPDSLQLTRLDQQWTVVAEQHTDGVSQ